MQDPGTFYKYQLDAATAEAHRLKLQSNRLSILRLLVFVMVVIALYYLRSQALAVVTVAILGLTLFLWLLSVHSDVRTRRQLALRLASINQDELHIAAGAYLDRNDGHSYLSTTHDFSQDIDLFGKGSFFQYMNRTGLKEGSDKLASFLMANEAERISDKQYAIKELSSDPEWMQQYTAEALGLNKDETSANVTNWIKSYTPFVRTYYFWIALLFGATSVVLIVLTALQMLPLKISGYWLLFGLGLSAIQLNKVNRLSFKASKSKEVFRQYGLLLKKIEERRFHSEFLKIKQQSIELDQEKASSIFRKFSRALDALDHRNNLIIGILGNGFFLWDVLQSYRIEKWINTYGEKAGDWFEVVALFDAFNSLGVFAFNHQKFCYPELLDKGHLQLISTQNLGHPLIDKNKRVCSDLNINSSNFFIITGANMAGKSTFLRSVALHIVMANLGLPVCAESSSYQPIKLITSMRTSDSLAEESSYFFSELTRLKYIVEALKKERYFVILDEILKGTNSTDKAIGSKKFVERLVALKACGIIATHDLSLTETAKNLEVVENYFFDAAIKEDELYFDYKLKRGVCENMNASFLLRKMDIVE